jgi:hypothetical protein
MMACMVWGLWALMTLFDFTCVARYGLSTPFMDDWWMVPPLTGNETVGWSWAWSQYNEHRYVLVRPLLLFLYHLAGFDFRAAAFLNVFILAALAGMMIRTAAAVRGRSTLTDAFFPMVLLHFGQSENLIWSWQLVYIFAVGLIGIFLTIVVRSGNRLTGWWALAGGVCLLVLPLSGGMGLLFVPSLSVWLLAQASANWRRGRSRDAWILGGLTIATLLVSALYLIGFHRPGLLPASHKGNTLTTCLQVLSVAFGQVDTRYWWLWGALGLVLLSAAAILSVRAALKLPAERFRALGLLAYLVGVAGLVLAIGWGRSGFGLFGRYTTLMAPGLCAVYFIGLLYEPDDKIRFLEKREVGSDRRHWFQKLGLLPLILFLCATIMIGRNTRLGLEGAARLRAGEDDFVRDIRAGLPPLALTDRYTRYPFMLWPYKDQLASWMAMLQKAGVEPFRELRPDPKFQVIPLTRDKMTQKGGNQFILDRPRFVYAMRLKYSYKPLNPYAVSANFRFFWRSAAGNTDENVQQYVLAQSAEENSLIIWINSPLYRFTIFPDDKPCDCQLGNMELLVPESI